MQELVYGLDELAQVAQWIRGQAKGSLLWCFYGEMGVGKTTLITELARQLGVKDQVSSPTFSLVNEYEAGSETVFHFDFYRVKDLEEVYDIGYETYFNSNAICLIEWPERIEPLLAGERYLKLNLSILENKRRIVAEVIE